MISRITILAVVRLVFLAGQLSVYKRRHSGTLILLAAAEHLINPSMTSRKTTVVFDNELTEERQLEQNL